MTRVIFCCFPRETLGSCTGTGAASSGAQMGCRHCRKQIYSLGHSIGPTFYIFIMESILVPKATDRRTL